MAALLLGMTVLAATGAADASHREWAIGVGSSALVIAALVAHWTIRSVLRPLKAAVVAAKRVTAGDLTVEWSADRSDEIGQLLHALQEMSERMFGIVSDVRTRTLAVATSSGQVSADNLAFASRTKSAAHALESTASSMEELTAAVEQSAENAKRGHALATSALDYASQGGDAVGRVVDTMSSIRASSHKIVDIIAVIDGIAFQTNILALNAAIEAATAGDQGRGFAVVAGEVRTLAKRSAEAARAIKELIEDSVGKVDTGSKLVDDAGATMQQIVGSVKRVADIMTEMTSAAQEQSAGIAEIGRAIIQIDSATQQNAALVDEAAEPVKALHEQASALTDAVSFFKLGEREFASADDAVALVQRAAAFMRSRGRDAVLAEVNKRDKGELVDRDLYLSVYSTDAQCIAHGANKRLIGADGRVFKDIDGRLFVADIVATANRIGHGRVDYKWLHTVTQKPMLKSAYFEKHGDLVLSCGSYS
ncbi:MAG TPA: methyl-accepting chemotaxis protein, partial [Albitalea sp.]|nr:methyl-accepting chemotaxis protein [Albitalea sp.]